MIWDIKRVLEIKCPRCETPIPLRALESIYSADYRCTGCERNPTKILQALSNEFSAHQLVVPRNGTDVSREDEAVGVRGARRRRRRRAADAHSAHEAVMVVSQF
jgi:hypothetical protein